VADQYFARRPAARSQRFEFSAAIRGHTFRFVSDRGVFSKSRVDRGTELLAEALEVRPGETLLDLGCGIGVLGIAIAKTTEAGRVWMTDVNERAVALAARNASRNGVGNRAIVKAGEFYAPVRDLAFAHIATNPPIRAGQNTVRQMIDEAPDHLLDGGALWLVARTRQGAPSLQDRMRVTFGHADVVARGSGYRVLRSTFAADRRANHGAASEQHLYTCQG